MRFILTVLLALGLASTAFAGPQTTVGGKRLEDDMVHHVRSGWPSTGYEWWNKGRKSLDWAIGAEMVYGPWSGAWDDPRIAFAVTAPLRFHLWNKKRPNATTDLGFRVTPGLMAGSAAVNTPTVISRVELAVPVTVDVNPKLNVITGAVIPLDLGWVKNTGFVGAVPLMARLGIEIEAGKKAAPFVLMEVGPGIGFSRGNGASVDLAARIWLGTSFWGVISK